MPYCCQCGNEVGPTNQFCGKCGARQTPPGSQPGAAPADFLNKISDRNASLLCYIPMVGWIAAIVVLATERFRHDTRVRFHAFQGLYLFVAWLLVEWVVSPALYATRYGYGFPIERTATGILHLLIMLAWIIMIIKVSHNEDYRLPIVGELADRSVSEQRS
jgi:uncharacterized membrane protein